MASKDLIYIAIPLIITISCGYSPEKQEGSINSPAQEVVPEPKYGIKDDWLITPSKGIGGTYIGENVEATVSRLGKPDLSDAAMGKAWLTWEGERDEHNNRSVLNIYTSYADTSMAWKSVQLVRVTSPSFRTTDSIGVYSGINSIKMKYSNVSLAGKYRDGSRILNIYEDRQSGIAFETANTGDQELCVAIVVFKAGESFVNTYIPYHENPL